MKYLIILAVLVSPPLFSQQLSQIIVVTASGLPESVESTPAAVSVITEEEIEERAIRDVADALREVPGLNIVRGGSPGKVTTLFTRGSNSTHTLVLWNGIEANNPFFSGYDWGRFSTAGVDRIEVVRGPYSALYGSDAVAGVINVLTAPPRTGIEIAAQAGENGLLNGRLHASYATDAWNGDGSVEHRQDDGFAANDDLEQQTAIAGFAWTRDGFTAGLRGRYMSYELGIPFATNASGSAFEPRPNRREGGDELQIALPVRYTRGAWHHELTVSRNENELEFRDPQDSFGRTYALTDTDTNRALITSRVATRSGTLVGGVEYERGRVLDQTNFGTSIDDRTRTSRSAFVEDRISVPLGGSSLEIAAGVRYDSFDSFGSETSPRFAAAWIGGRNKFRVAYGRAFRAPSIGELYFPFFGNDALEAEHTRSGEIGFDRFLVSGGHVSVTLFDNHFTNLIVYDNISNMFQNVGEAESRGIELGINVPLTTALAVGGSYTWLDTEATATGEPLLRRPRHSGSLSLHHQRGRVGSTLVAVHTGRRTDPTDLFPFGNVFNDAYTVADLKVDYAAGMFQPFVKVENVTDEEYQEAFGYPSPRRRAIAGLRLAIK